MSDDKNDRPMDARRRNFLLAGSALSVLGTVGLGAAPQVAQAQTPAPAARSPISW